VTMQYDNPLKRDVLARSVSRRAVIKRSIGVGLAAPLAINLLAACGGDDATPAPAANTPAPAAANTPVPAAASTPAPAGNTPAPAAASTPAPAGSTPPPAAEPTATQAQTSTPADGDPVYGGTFIKLEANDFVTMWPMFTTGPTLDLIYDNLCKWRWDGGSWDFVPWLAVSWELAEDNARFTLRDGVKFHDGSDCNAEAAVWNVEMWVTHEQSIAKNSLAAVDVENPAEAVDELTFQMNLTDAAGSLLSQLSDLQRTTPLHSPLAWETMGEDGVKLHGVGTGPFVYKEWITGSQATVVRNEDYWGTDEHGNQLPFVDEAVYRWVSDDSVRLIEMRSGNAHMSTFIRGRDVPTVSNDPNLNYVENPESGGTLYRIFFNAVSGPFAEDVALRQAVQYAIDREAIARAVGGGIGFPAKYDLLPGAVGYDETIPFYSFDLDKAKELRAQSSAPAGLEARLTIITREADQQMAQMIQQMLAAIDIKITVDALERVAWGDQVRRNSDFEVATQRTTSPPDPDQHWTLTWNPGGVASYSRMDEPDIWQLIADGRGSYDRAERDAIYRQLQIRMFETAWWGNIWVQPNNYLFSNRVKNIPMIYGEWTREEQFWLEK
jgi:peptide/nickel transport system substrate-binding protein